MKNRKLGITGIEISFPGISIKTEDYIFALSQTERRNFLKSVFQRGINFFEITACDKTLSILPEIIDINSNAVISVKSAAHDAISADNAVEAALAAVGRDYIDIWLMDNVRDFNTIRKHFEAFEQYLRLKDAGKIRALGVSAVCADGIMGALKFKEIEVVNIALNAAGIGLQCGTRQDAEKALKLVHDAGKGVYTSSVFGFGHLLNYRNIAIDYIRSLAYIDSAVTGMSSDSEIAYNIAAFQGAKDMIVPDITGKKLHISEFCTGCGVCVENCPKNAVIIKSGVAVVDTEKCNLCGLCGAKCTDCAIKIR